MANKDQNKSGGNSGSESRNRKQNSNNEIQQAWKEFTKDSEKAKREINEAFSDDNKEWSVGRVSIVVAVSLLVAMVVGALIKFLTW